MEQALRAALKEAARVGVTSVHDITLDSESADGSFNREIRLVRRAELEGWLTCRMYEIVPLAQGKKLADAGISRDMGSDFLKLGRSKPLRMARSAPPRRGCLNPMLTTPATAACRRR